MERKKNGTFAKGHIGYGKGTGWKNEERICKCGKIFNPAKKFQKSCSQHCAMVGTKRRLGSRMSEEARKKSSKGWFKNGQSSWNKGTKGVVSGYWTGKKRAGISGARHHNWKGGITSINEKIRKSLEYKLWRKAVFERDNYTCIWCGTKFIKGKTGKVKLHADHIKPFAHYPELRLELSNGRTLCELCHETTDTYGHNTK